MNGLPTRWLRPLAMNGVATASAAARIAVGLRASSTFRFKRYRKPHPELTKFPEGHGEQIWIFNHIMTNQVVYSHTPVLRNNRALKQLPFNGKKTKPAKLRKDYWRPMALIQFDKGAGVVGQSVFQKLREFRRRHELSWGHQKEELYKLDRKELGAALNDQRANSIADMAAVLAGSGLGNRIRPEKDGEPSKNGADLVQATVFWADEFDRNNAESWSKNVIHVAGIPSLKSKPTKAEVAA